jgi:hypothetical protein
MRSLARVFALALVCALGAVAQYDTYTISYSAAIDSATTALAIQIPSGQHITEVEEVSAQCIGTAPCFVRLEINSATITTDNATAATIQALNPETTPAALIATPNLRAYFGTNVPVGTIITPEWRLPANALVPLPSGRRLTTRPSGSSNYIVRVSQAYTGTVLLFMQVRVRR